MSNFKNIPPEIARKLDESVRRVRTILLFRGACMAVAVAVASVLAIMAIDAMIVIFSPVVRWALWGAGVAATAATAWFSLIKPLRRRFSAWEIAALIERNHPELEERLSTVVGLAQSGDADASSGLLQALTLDAIRDAGTVSPQKEFTSRTVRPRLVAAAAVLAVLGGLFAAFPSATRRLVTRALVPSAEVDNIYASSLKVSPGDVVLLEGSPLTVNLAVGGGFPSRAYVRTRIDGRSEAVERMTRTSAEGDAHAFYEFNYPQPTKSFTYRMNCGSGLTRGYRVEVVPEPSFDGRTIALEHPAYTGREPLVYTNTAAIVGLAGSKVRVTVRPSREGLSGCAILPGGRTVPGEPTEDGGLAFAFDLDAASGGPWGISVWDVHGFSNKVETASVTIVKDAPPAIRLVEPSETTVRLPAIGELPLACEIKEDFGLARASLEMCVGAGAWAETEALEPVRTDAVTWAADTVVRLAGKEIGKAGTVRFRVRVEDNLPAEQGGPGVAYSPEITVNVVSYDTSLARQSLAEEIRESNQALDDVRKHLENTMKNAADAGGSFRLGNNHWHLSHANKVLTWAKGGMVQAERILSEFIAGLAESRLESGVEIFRPVRTDHVQPTRGQVEDIYLLARYEEKAVACTNAVPHVKACLDALAAARRRFDALTKAAKDLQKLADFAEREKALAEMAEEGEIDAEELAKSEEELLDRFNKEFQDELEQDLDAQKKKAGELAAKTEELEKRQDAIKEKVDAAQSEEERKALAQEESKLANDIKEHMKSLDRLADEIEKKAGPPETDANKTSEPVREAQNEERQAAKDAAEAAENVQNGRMEDAKREMDAVSDALAEARKDLAAAQEKMDAKTAEMEAQSAAFEEMQSALEAALEAAQAAAEQAQMEQQNAQQQGEQQGEQPKGDQQQNGEQQQGEQQGEQQQGEQQNGEQQSSQAQQKAQQAARQAAQKMQQMAQQQAQQSGLPMDQFTPSGLPMPGQPGDKPDPKGKAPAMNMPAPEPRGRPRTADPAAENDDEAWFKMKSESGTGADADALDDVPEEYRTLVREYFKALGNGGAK